MLRADRQSGREKGRQEERQPKRWQDREKGQTFRKAERQVVSVTTGRETGRQMETGRQRRKQTGIQADRQPERGKVWDIPPLHSPPNTPPSSTRHIPLSLSNEWKYMHNLWSGSD